ncbi:MAG: ATP-binding protein [Thermoguttaceae bacterium]|jgi:signal transduction histidine kinase|nr:ATP-binding protein [Thermoguttaceae bacterium]
MSCELRATREEDSLVMDAPAPSGRVSSEVLQRQRASVVQTPLLQATLDAMSEMVLVLNPCRQVVAANRRVLELVEKVSSGIVGRRPGEIVGCAHAAEGPDGCGTGMHCVTCGAVQAIVQSSQTQRQVTRECRIVLDESSSSGALDLRVTATPVQIGGEPFIICAIRDISDQKRLAVLSRMFFHDVLNTAGAVRGYASLLADELGGKLEDDEPLRALSRLAEQLIEDIQSQRDLMAAESGDLTVQWQPVRVAPFLAELRTLFQRHPSAEQRVLRLGEVCDITLMTDPRLLSRVLGNMIKNALEATPPGGEVSMSCDEREGDVVFRVRNPGVMPNEVQLQIFHRSFSTKGQPGRGIGTHSMRLLGERYLGGCVAFSSTQTEGTVFTLALPMAHQRRNLG